MQLDIHMELKERLIYFRRTCGLSQEEVAARLNVSRQAISHWEKGTAKPSLENLLLLSQVYDVSMDELSGRKAKEVPLYDSKEEHKKAESKKRRPHDWQRSLILVVLSCIVVFGAALFLLHTANDQQKQNRYTEELPMDQVDVSEAEEFDLFWP